MEKFICYINTRDNQEEKAFSSFEEAKAFLVNKARKYTDIVCNTREDLENTLAEYKKGLSSGMYIM